MGKKLFSKGLNSVFGCRTSFCSMFLAEAREFKSYYTWVLAFMISQTGNKLHTFPEVAFQVRLRLNFGFEKFDPPESFIL